PALTPPVPTKSSTVWKSRRIVPGWSLSMTCDRNSASSAFVRVGSFMAVPGEVHSGKGSPSLHIPPIVLKLLLASPVVREVSVAHSLSNTGLWLQERGQVEGAQRMRRCRRLADGQVQLQCRRLEHHRLERLVAEIGIVQLATDVLDLDRPVELP